MMLKSSLKIVAVFVFVLALGASALAQADWTGTYTFDESGGRTAGGTAIFISHMMNVVEGDDGLVATITANGYQTSRDLVCTAKVSGQKLMIYFEDYGEDNVFEHYEKGDLLLTLEATAKGKLLTTWGKYEPATEPTDDAKKKKIFFVKLK